MFDKVINRKGTSCSKYDDLEHYFGSEDLDPLWVADMDFGIPDFIQKELEKRVSHNIYGYGKQDKEIYESIKDWMFNQHQWQIDIDNISLCNGVVPAYSACIEAFSDENDEVIVQTPVYFPLFQCVKANNRKLLINPLKETDGYYTMDFEHLESIISPKTKILALCSPHNPVGRVWDKSELEKLALICIKHNITIISDEIHADLTFKKFIPIAAISKDISNITVTLNSPGKTFNIAGLNASYCITSNKTLKKSLDRVIKRRVINSINVFGLIGMKVAYAHETHWLEDLKNYIEENINFTKDYLESKSSIVLYKPEATYLLWLNFKHTKLEHNEIKNLLLKEAKVALNDGLSFGKNGDLYFRLNCAKPKSELKKSLDKIINVIN